MSHTVFLLHQLHPPNLETPLHLATCPSGPCPATRCPHQPGVGPGQAVSGTGVAAWGTLAGAAVCRDSPTQGRARWAAALAVNYGLAHVLDLQ